MRPNFLIVLAQKESSVLFQGRSLIEQRNFYILSLIAFPPICSKYFHCPVQLRLYSFHVTSGTGEAPNIRLVFNRRVHYFLNSYACP